MPQDDHKLNLEENSKYRVAFDLMKVIKSGETQPAPEDFREYHLRLFRLCIKAGDTYYPIEEVVTGTKKDTHMGIRF